MTKPLRFGIALLLATSAALVLSTRPAATYYDDAHYALTYYLARECGLTPLQAFRLASANVAIDYSKLTEPVQVGRTALDAAAGPVALPIFPGAQEPRVNFHAFRDARKYGADQKHEADQAITAQLEALRALGLRQRNPGVFMHFLQDINPHHGYTSLGGHWFTASNNHVDLLADRGLEMGSTTDYLSHKSAHARDMVFRTTEAISKFMQIVGPKQRRDSCSVGGVTALLTDLARVNIIHTGTNQYLSQLPKIVSDQFGDLAKSATPSAENGDDVVTGALQLRGDISPYPRSAQRIPYEYDAGGNVTNLIPGQVMGDIDNLITTAAPIDSFTLYGQLRVQLQRAGHTGGKSIISVWAAPTRRTESPSLIECKDSGATEFFNLPVGDLIVQTTADGVNTRRRVTLNRLSQSVTIKIPREAQVARSCSATERKRVPVESCGTVESNRARYTPDSSESTDDSDACRERENAEDKRKADEKSKTPASAGPPPAPPIMTPVPTPAPVPMTPADGSSAGAGGAGTKQPAVQPPQKGGVDPTTVLLVAALAGGAGYYAYTKMCAVPTDNVLTVCSSQGGSSAACKSAIAAADKYCKCKGYSGQSGGNCVK
jgi:hypothetical protein